MQINTLPVYSRLVDPQTVPEKIRSRLPDGWSLSCHQLETYQALASGNYDVVFNTAMTGDGKSLAAYLPTLITGQSVFAMYPTNELARDQEFQLENTRRLWGRSGINVVPMSANQMESIIARGLYDRKANVIRHLVDNNDIVLTNPDIFHYLAQFFYTRREDAPDMLFSRKIVDLFDLFIFDEFHVFQIPQIVAVLNALLLVREVGGMARPKKFLFLSATPDPLLKNYLDRTGFKSNTIQPEAQGWYLHSAEEVDERQWRPIVRGSNIHFWNTGGDYLAEQWAEDHLEDILLAFYRRNRPGAKGAFIVNSIAAAYRLFHRLAPRFKAEGLSVSLNTGFTGDTLRRASRDANLLIGTSTVDVGVDFRINFLIFESRDAGTFLQRLGRLGRHLEDGCGNSFSDFEAHALVPAFVRERLFTGKAAEPALLDVNTTVTRAQLSAAVRSAYPPVATFDAYTRAWGWVQSTHVYYRLGNAKIRGGYETARDALKKHYQEITGLSIKHALFKYRELSTEAPAIVSEAHSFRGGSPFDCAVLDESEPGRDAIKSYDLLSLTANGCLEWLGLEIFKREVEQRGAAFSITRLEKMAGWFRFLGFNPERRPIRFILRDALGSWSAEELGEVQVIDGVELDMSGVDWLSDLNDHLRRRKFVVTICLLTPDELRYRLYLPPMFGLWPCEGKDGVLGSIAFARDALLLNVALKERRIVCGGGAVIV